ncbi:hypothetical protein ACFQ1S_34005 [Kibdelosporangium lantanae]|uniref:Uncharacterized protein n=1 Tax=Kibdelosporangium lantanae TaxID=1497396 RepID=A0ABW3MLQ5_9PSEU
MPKKPNLGEPGKTALESLLVAIEKVNQDVDARGDIDVDSQFIALMSAAAAATDNFKRKEPDATGVDLVAKSGNTYRQGNVVPREKLTIQFYYPDPATGQPKHYTLP